STSTTSSATGWCRPSSAPTARPRRAPPPAPPAPRRPTPPTTRPPPAPPDAGGHRQPTARSPCRRRAPGPRRGAGAERRRAAGGAGRGGAGPARHARYPSSRGLRRPRSRRGRPDAPPRARHPRRRSRPSMEGSPPPMSKLEEHAGTPPSEHKAGFVSLIGRPNAGKSTLLNRLVGQKLAIVSPRPQTTRNRITGILTRPDAQIVFVHTPGLHAGRGRLGEFMLQTAQRAVEDVDAVCLVVDATERAGPDELVLAPLREYGGLAVCALNKVDLVHS